MIRSWFIVITVCLAAATGLGYFKYQQIQAAIALGAAFPESIEAVEVFVALEELWQPVTSVTAEVVPTRSVTLSNELAGTIAHVGFTSGATVIAGQVLVQLDTSEESAQRDAATAEAEIARLDLERNEKLIASGAAAQEARDRAKARFSAALAAVRRLDAVIAKKTLRAPFNAKTGLHQLEVGQYLDKGDIITRLIGIDDEVWIDFTLPQEQAVLEIGTQISVTVSKRDRTVNAKIIARDAFVNESSRNVGFRAVTDNQNLGAFPGSLVTVEVPLGELRTATLVPATAVRRDTFGAKVFVLKPAEEGALAAERAERRSVTLGPQRGDLVVVASGMRPGERVAANGSFKLRDGSLVNVIPRNSSVSAQLSTTSEGIVE